MRFAGCTTTYILSTSSQLSTASELLRVTRSHGCDRQKRTVYPRVAGADSICLVFDGIARASRRAYTHLVLATQALTSPIECS